MVRTYNRLTAARVEKLKLVPGKHPDGDGLYLKVTPTLIASWAFRYMINGAPREMGLGPLRHITLSHARQRANEARHLKRDGIDPLEARRAKRQGAMVAKAKTMTFAQCAKAYVVAKQTDWRSAQHRHQWVSSLEAYVYPIIGKLPVEGIDTALVLRVLEPIWNDKPETASRVRGRIENVLDWAKARGLRSGENPAQWKGHLKNLLASHKVRVIVHHPALPYREIAAFMSDLRQHHDDQGARALELLILTATRSSELLKAKWSEFGDLADRVWTIPAERMKAGKEHRVPLSGAALAIIAKQKAIQSNEYVFAGRNGTLNHGTFSAVLQRLGRTGLTAHGFRSTFRDWVAEQTSFPSEVAEMALAHAVGDKVEAAYRRGDLFQKRLDLAEAWATYCDGGAEVVSLAEVRSA